MASEEKDTIVAQPHFGIDNQPKEIWFLRNLENGTFVPALDCTGEPLLAYASWDEAIQGADHHDNWYDMQCEPWRFFPPQSDNERRSRL